MSEHINKHIRLAIHGMTCTECEEHVAKALQSVGAENISANFRRGEAVFELDGLDRLDAVKQIITDIGYQPGTLEVVNEPQYTNNLQESNEYDYDLLIIGSGGAAFSAAIQAVSYGAKVGMIERSTIGGTCVNIGCVPSKTLLRASEIQHLASHHPFNGLQITGGSVDLQQLVGQKNELVANMRQHKYIDLIDEYGLALIQGEACFVNEHTVEMHDRQMTSRKFLIATGASPAIPHIPGLHDVDYLTSTTALNLIELPKRLAIIGSGYIALELGQMFHNLGVEVTLMQRSARVLKSYEPEVSEAITQALTAQGMHIMTGVTYNHIEQIGSVKRVYLTLQGEERIVEAEALLVAIGRAPNTKALNLDAAQVKIGEQGEVTVDDYLRTTNPRIYAAGDVTMGPQFVYVAAYEGNIVAENSVGGGSKSIDLTTVPHVTFTNPAVASVGLTAEQAKSAGYEVIVSVLPLDAVPRALVNRETTGVFKLVADARTRKILGAHIVAENAGDVIYAATLAVKFGLTIEDLRSTFAPYLTMSEGLKLAILTFDKDVSMLSCCAG